jgi:hypothetical protein
MNCLNCPACGGTISTEPYRALDASEWCQPCGQDAQRECETNCGPENEHGAGDLHAEVLGWLSERAEEYWWRTTRLRLRAPLR